MKREAQQKLMLSRQKFILSWLKRYRTIDVCDEFFHNAYHKRFGGARRSKTHGILPVESAMRMLTRMYKNGEVNRAPVGIIPGPGFPTWVYVYTLVTDSQLNLKLNKRTNPRASESRAPTGDDPLSTEAQSAA